MKLCVKVYLTFDYICQRYYMCMSNLKPGEQIHGGKKSNGKKSWRTGSNTHPQLKLIKGFSLKTASRGFRIVLKDAEIEFSSFDIFSK